MSGNSNNDIVPIGKAIAIILSIAIIMIVFIGGAIFLGISSLSDKGTILVSSNKDKASINIASTQWSASNGKDIFLWKFIDDSNFIMTQYFQGEHGGLSGTYALDGDKLLLNATMAIDGDSNIKSGSTTQIFYISFSEYDNDILYIGTTSDSLIAFSKTD